MIRPMGGIQLPSSGIGRFNQVHKRDEVLVYLLNKCIGVEVSAWTDLKFSLRSDLYVALK